MDATLTNFWLIKAGTNGDLWPTWKKEHFISIGWNIGNIANYSIEEIKSKIEKNPFFTQKPEYIFNILHTFIGLVFTVEAMEADDIVIILGNYEILDLGIIGIYVYRENGLGDFKDQVYCRQIRFLKKGPIKISDLPQQFQQTGEYSLYLDDVLRKYPITKEIFDILVNSIAENINSM